MSRLLRCALFVLACAGFSPLADAQYRLVTAAAPAAFARKDASPLILRQRAVRLGPDVLPLAFANRDRYIEIAFFDDAVYRIYLTGREETYNGAESYTGRLAADPLSTFVIVNNGGTISVLFTTKDRRFSMQGSAARGYVASEHVLYDRPDHGPNYRAPPSPALSHAKSGAKVANAPTFVPPPETARDDGSTMDVMVVYTPAARAQNGGTAQMQANIIAQRDYTNLIYANSNVVQRLRLVYMGEVAHTEVNMDVDLPRLEATSDGFLDEVPLLRDLYHADFVSLWGVYTGSCGLGSLMATESATFHPNAYNAVASPACTGAGSATFAHELGHNMGLRHDAFMDSATTVVTAEATGLTTTIPYAHGYVDITNRFRTVMAYPDACNALSPGCNRIPYFSNPAISYNNNPPYGLAFLAPTGTAIAHERQALNDTRETTANFRASLSTFTGPGILSFLPVTYTVAEGAGNVVLKVGRHVGSTGAVSVNYATANGTATAGSDYTTTAGTLTWPAGDTTDKTIAVPILQDAILEGTETFTVTLSVPTGGATISGAGASAIVRITDDEPDTFPVGTALPAGYSTTNTPNANTPDSTWGVDLNQGYLSPASLRSAQAYSPDSNFTTNGNSDLEYTAAFSAGTATFYYKLSGYQTLSGFEFQVDNVAAFSNNTNTAGEVDWTLVSVPITAGTHTLRWRFKNKLSFACARATPAATGGALCADRAWIDTVTLPANTLPTNPPRLANISTRMQVLTGNDVMIGGFVIGGSANKTVAIVATGPSLGAFGIANPLANPTLTLVRSSDQTVIATNDDWQSAANSAQLQSAGFAPSNALESAILINLPPGAYTAIVSGVGNGTGVGLVAVYEVDRADVQRLWHTYVRSDAAFSVQRHEIRVT